MKRRRALLAVLIAFAAAVAVAAGREREQTILFEDERQFLVAATRLATSGPSPRSARAAEVDRSYGILREPGYPAFVALLWRATGATPPVDAAALAAAPATPALYRPIRVAQWALLVIAATASGWAVARLRGPAAGGVAAALVAASPTLGLAACEFMSESLAATLLALFAAALVALVSRPSRGALAALVAVAALFPLVRAEAIVLLPIAVAFAARERAAIAPDRRWLPPLAAALLVALPALGWMARNRAVTGHFVLSDRGGLALAVRAALDVDLARFGARVAALSFTPTEGAHRRALELEPESTLLDHRPEGSDNFVLRTYRQVETERAAPGADPLAVDAGRGRAALGEFLSHPMRHTAGAAIVAWRGLFAERSPAWAHPFDLALPLGLLLGASFALFAAWSVSRRDVGALALLAPAAALFLFHAAATEFLPRYAVPLLPAAWASVAALGASLLHHRRELAPVASLAGDAALEEPD